MYGVFVLKLGQIYSFESIIKIKFVNVQKVSIIFPVYNADKYLGECLNSIIKQSYSNWELIAVDDYSNDNSWRLLEDYQKKDSRIRIFRNRKEKGILPALQQASLHIRGTLVTRMDADDWMPEYKIETMIKEVRPKVIVTGLVQYFTDEGEMGQGYLKYENWMNEVLLSQNPWQHLFEECIIPSPAWMMSYEDFEALGGFANGQYPEDYDFCFRLYQAGFKIKTCPRVLHYWRDHSSRSSRQLKEYADQNFFKLKVHYLQVLELVGQNSRLLLWGAGKKGKALAALLNQSGICFVWSCNSPGKWGHIINGVQVEKPSTAIKKCIGGKAIIAVSGPTDKLKVREMLTPYFEPDCCYSFY
jgi:glycosyltransferase involved in cell wall biosynthesis